MAALLIYNRALSAGERAEVETYLQGKYVAIGPDTMPPVITVPANMSVQAPDTNGVIVDFTTSAIDNVSGTVPTINTPASGSLFPIGTTTVTTTAVDAAGNSASSTFTVTVTLAPQPITPLTVIPLISGNSADLLYTWSPAQGIGAVTDDFEVQDGTLHVVGNEGGAIISTDRYRDYVLVFEYKWGPRQWDDAQGAAKNTGVLVHCRGYEGGHDNRNMPGLEVQLAEGSAGDFLLEMGNDELGQPAADVDGGHHRPGHLHPADLELSRRLSMGL